MTFLPQTFLIVDAHEVVAHGTQHALEKAYPQAQTTTASTVEAALSQLAISRPRLLITDVLLSENKKERTTVETGINFLQQIMKTYPGLNILIQSSQVRSLIRLQPSISTHRAGFTIVDKNLPVAAMLERANWSLRGILYTPADIRCKLEVRPEWLQLLQLAFSQGLQDRTIAKRMNVAERTVRHYWSCVQDTLNVYPPPGTNTRIQTEICARAAGLID